MTKDEILKQGVADLGAVEQVNTPKMAVLKDGPGTLVTVSVELTDEQVERIRKRPKRGYRIPFETKRRKQ